MKKQIITLIILLISISSKAQEIPFEIIERINTVDYIFEGIVINKKSYQSIDHRRIYTTNLIEITKILKGNLICGTVEIITEGGNIGTKIMYADHSLELEIDSKGIFLCKLSTRELPQTTFFTPTNTIALEGIYENQSYIKYTEDDNNNLIAHDITGNYDSIIQFYNLAQIITGFNFIDCGNNSLLFSPPKVIPPYPTYLQDVLPIYTQIPLDSTLNIQYKLKNTYISKKKRISNKIIWGLTTPIITGQNPKYCEFDITVKDTVGTKFFALANVRLNYPTNVFGQFIASNGKVEVSRSALILDTNTYSSPNVTQLNAGYIFIDMGAKLNSINKFLVTKSFQKIFHVKIEIANCDIGSVIKIKDSIGSTPPYTLMWGSAYSDSANGVVYIDYDTLEIDTAITIPACGATISSFTPLFINGGVGDILKIKGYQFGATKGVGNIYFNDANNPSTGISLPLNDSDYVSWSDTLIKIILPSIHQGATNNNIGTGKFRIITTFGYKDTSINKLFVNYSLKNVIDVSAKKNNVLHYNQNSKGGYDFYVDTSVSHNTKAYDCIKKAMREWTCATGINFKIIKDTSGLLNIKSDDSINHITFGEVDSVAGLMYITSDVACVPPPFYQHLNTDMDLIISNDPTFTWFYDTTGTKPIPIGEIDFYWLALHEIGHAVNLKHVIDPKRVMHYAIAFSNTDTIPAIDRAVNLKLDLISAVKGGRRQVGLDTNIANFVPCPSNITPLISLGICDSFKTLSINNINSNVFSIYPNPFSNLINISNNSEIECISIYNIDGKLVCFKNNINSKFISLDLNNNQLQTNNIYFVKLTNKHGISSSKLIKHE